MNPPANWYPDPTGRHGQRYWDGEQWTEHVFTEGVQGVDPLDAGGDTQAAGATTGEATNGHNSQDGQAESLFADAGEAQATTASPEGDEVTWEPADQPDEEPDDEQAVAPEVEAEDVVANLDEVGEAEPTVSETADTTLSEAEPATSEAADTTEEEAEAGAPEDDAAAGDGAAAQAPGDDFSDAFMVTPETVSRLVSRRATTEPREATEPQESTPPEVSADDAAAEPAPDGEPSADAGQAPGAIDAPPPAMPPASAEAPDASDHDDASAARSAGDGGLGITGDLVGGAFAEREEAGPVALQNSRLLRCSLGEGPGVIARQGTMVAYQGDVSFERQGAGGVTRALKRAATGEGLAMMRSEGTGDVFFADGAQHVFLLHLHGGPGLSVNGRNVLAFSAALAWDIERVKGATLLAGGLFNTTLTGTGWVALVSDGEPVVLRTDEAPTFVDVNALVAWSGGLTTRVTNTVTAKSLVGLGSGEAFQMAFEGTGIVVVQPSEGATGGAATG